MAERFIASVLKTEEGESLPGVQIPHHPPRRPEPPGRNIFERIRGVNLAQLTTTMGETIAFEAAAVIAVAERDADTDDDVTTVYGIAAGPVRTLEGAPELLNRLGVADHFAQLTRPDGSAIWVSGAATSAVRPPAVDEYPPNVGGVVNAGALAQAVQESVGESRRRLDAAGAHL